MYLAKTHAAAAECRRFRTLGCAAQVVRIFFFFVVFLVVVLEHQTTVDHLPESVTSVKLKNVD